LGEEWQGGGRQGRDRGGGHRFRATPWRETTALGFASPSTDTRFNNGAGRCFNPSVFTGMPLAGPSMPRRARDTHVSSVDLVVPLPVKPPAPGADTAACALRASAQNKRTPRLGEARRNLVRLIEFSRDPSKICRDRVKCRCRTANLVCSKAPADCELRHMPKCNDQLHPGWYITNPRGIAIFPEHFVSAEAAAESPSFKEIRHTELPLPTMVRLVQSIRKDADSKPADMRKFVCVAGSAPAVAKTPACARRPTAPAEGGDTKADAKDAPTPPRGDGGTSG
jgi:hypothetical protein